MRSLFNKLVGKPKRLETLVVTIFSRRNCSCCDKAKAILDVYQVRHGFQIVVVDIDTDPNLVSLYGQEIPVVAFDDKVRFKGIINPVLLDRLIEQM